MQKQTPDVIVAEDNPTNRLVICAMLRALNIDASVATNGAEAVILARNSQPDLILMDINMPILNGVEAARQILAMPGFETIRIVAVTANATRQQEQECQEAGFSGFITKPLDAHSFKKQISSLLFGDINAPCG